MAEALYATRALVQEPIISGDRMECPLLLHGCTDPGLLRSPLAKYDEAIPLVAADLMLHGRKAAVDFLSFYPPLYYYLILAGFQSVGRSALVPIFLAAVIYIMLIIAAARFFWKSFPHLRPLTPLVILPTVIAIGLFTYPAWPGYAVSFLSLLVYMSSRNAPLPDQRWIAL